MLKHTFRHLPGVGPKTERRLWEEGILTLEDLLAAGPARYREEAARSIEELARGNAEYFAEGLPSSESWRLFHDFRDSAAYVDIETTGTGDMFDHITAIALYDGRTIRTYVHGRNLADFEADIAAYKLLVTFNGKCFDAPFIERQFRMRLPRAHIDLRFLLRGLGYAGGLKRCEKYFGIERHEAEGLDGYFAVLLWREFLATSDERCLDTLLAYNVYDVLSLETLLVRGFNELVQATPFACHYAMPIPEEPANPFHADLAVIERIRNYYGI